MLQVIHTMTLETFAGHRKQSNTTRSNNSVKDIETHMSMHPLAEIVRIKYQKRNKHNLLKCISYLQTHMDTQIRQRGSEIQLSSRNNILGLIGNC